MHPEYFSAHTKTMTTLQMWNPQCHYNVLHAGVGPEYIHACGNGGGLTRMGDGYRQAVCGGAMPMQALSQGWLVGRCRRLPCSRWGRRLYSIYRSGWNSPSIDAMIVEREACIDMFY